MIEKEWIPVVGTLLGVAIGGGIRSLIKFLELNSQKNNELRKTIL